MKVVLSPDYRLCCLIIWIYIQCESGLALASFLPPVFDHNVLQVIKKLEAGMVWERDQRSSLQALPSLDSLQYNHAKTKGEGLAT